MFDVSHTSQDLNAAGFRCSFQWQCYAERRALELSLIPIQMCIRDRLTYVRQFFTIPIVFSKFMIRFDFIKIWSFSHNSVSANFQLIIGVIPVKINNRVMKIVPQITPYILFHLQQKAYLQRIQNDNTLRAQVNAFNKRRNKNSVQSASQVSFFLHLSETSNTDANLLHHNYYYICKS